MTVTLKDLAADWSKKTTACRPDAFWFWNAAMTTDDIDAALTQIAAQGIAEVVFHPIHGLEIEYLSPMFFDRMRHALATAKRLGLRVWIYDEFGWPSGVVGGKLLREHPEHRGWYLRFARTDDGRIVAEPLQSDRLFDNTMGSPWTQGELGYVDTLSSAAMACFIELTHDAYYRECREFFGDVIVGFFTDEPATMVDINTGRPGAWHTLGLPWTPELPKRFRERFGHDVESVVDALGDDGPSQAKADYWAIVKEMHIAAYHRQIGQWCRNHGVAYTGHLGEDMFVMQVRFGASIFQALREMDEPGIDFLGCGPHTQDRLLEQIVVCSIARHTGKRRVFCESCGISPMDVRLGAMVDQLATMALVGVDHHVMMGFHQSLAGARKVLYWPPMFHQSSWWPMWNNFRETLGRAIGLTMIGQRRARIAVLYPQAALEQTDVFYTEVWQQTDGPTVAQKRLAEAILRNGETFEYVFTEILADAKVVNGQIVFPHAEYDRIIACDDLVYSDDDRRELDRLRRAGATICSDALDATIDSLDELTPSWSSFCSIDGSLGELRVHRFSYRDGEVIVVRNVSDRVQPVTVESTTHMLAEWSLADGCVIALGRRTQTTLPPTSMKFYSLTSQAIGAPILVDGADRREPVATKWTVSPEASQGNTLRLSKIKFQHETRGWLDAVPIKLPGPTPATFRFAPSDDFIGATHIPFRGEFSCSTIPESLNLVFEAGYLGSLAVNGTAIDLSSARPMPIWDASCRAADIHAAVRPGVNVVAGVLIFTEYETTIRNDAFFAFRPLPPCSIALAGPFRAMGGVISAQTEASVELPANLADRGWPELHGVVELTANVSFDAVTAKSIRAIELSLVAEDAVEVRIDGQSLGTRVMSPYLFAVNTLSVGEHVVSIRLAGTNANLLDDPKAWGVRAVNWVCP